MTIGIPVTFKTLDGLCAVENISVDRDSERPPETVGRMYTPEPNVINMRIYKLVHCHGLWSFNYRPDFVLYEEQP